MGSCDFMVKGYGKTAKEAFREAVQTARDYADDGYSGTIAEKSDYRTFDVPQGVNPREFAQKLLDDLDKYGPAGCIKLAEGEYLFFGWASC